MSCEIFENNRCLGCIALSPELDIDTLKKKCDIYKEEIKYLSKTRQVTTKKV